MSHCTRGRPTCVRTGVEVTGAVLDAEAVAVVAPVLGNGAVALPPGQLDSAPTTPGTTCERSPLPPAAVHLEAETRARRCSEEQPPGPLGAASHLDAHGVVLLGASPPVAHLGVAAAGAVRPGEVAGLADQLAAGPAGAPQLGAGLHVRARLGAGAERQLALAVQPVAGAGQVVRQRQLLLGRVQ